MVLVSSLEQAEKIRIREDTEMMKIEERRINVIS
jgi:hypothetical protein